MKGENGSIPAFARDILRTLEAAGSEAYCVGGCVRDTLLGRTPGDWDITTSARPEETLALFGADALPTGLRHGTVTVRRPDGSAEVTTFRRDGDYTDHRHPESVAFTDSLTEDLARRDFTVNAMALSLRGELRDPFHGREDLAAGRIRCVGEPARRFGEDALRILRGLRLAAQLGFSLHPLRGAGGPPCHCAGADLHRGPEAAGGGAALRRAAGVPGGFRRLLAGASAHAGVRPAELSSLL